MHELKEIVKKIAPDGVTSVSISKTDEELKADCELLCKAYNELQGSLAAQDGYHCEKCNNKGLFSVPVKDARGYWREESRYCECMKVRRTIRRLDKSGLKHIIRDYTFKSYAVENEWQKEIKESALRFVQDDDHNWFFIGGATGCGKTHICTAIAGYYLRHKNKEVRYMLWRDDVVKLKANVTDSEAYEKTMHEFKSAEVLYIDDLFKTGKTDEGMSQRPTAADINIAFELLNYRYNNPKLITIISSECRVTDILGIDEAVGGRIVERTAPYGYGINIKPDTGKNYRLKGLVEL